MEKELPKIVYNGKIYTFDYKLRELRTISKHGLKSIVLNNTELELLAHAIETKDRRLIRINMDDLRWKLKEVV